MASRSIDQSGILEADGTLPANFVEADNLANNSVTARTIDPSVTTDQVTEGIANLYYTVNRARLAISVTGGGSYDNVNGIITVGGPGLNTTNVAEGANLYFTNARARAAISNIDSTIEYNPITGTIRANVLALGSGENVVTVQGQTGVVTLTTTDLPEGNNLYFTNTRAQVAIHAGLGISISNGQVNVDSNANIVFNELATTKLIVFDPQNVAANIEVVYDEVTKALVINSNIMPLTNETLNLGTIGENFNELYVKQIYSNNITVANSITADEFIGNVTGDLTKFILVASDNNSLIIDSSSNPDLFLPKGTKVRFDVSTDTLIGIGFDIGQYNASNNDITNGANLTGLTYYVNNQPVSGFSNWADSFTGANSRTIVYSIPQSAPRDLIYYATQFTEWRGNIAVAPPSSTNDLAEGSLNRYYTDQQVDDRLFAVADGNVGLLFDQGLNLLTLAQDISIDAGVIFDNVTANAFYSNAFYGTLYGNIVGQLSTLAGLTTTQLAEGSNAYFTVSRVRSNLNATNGIAYSSITGIFELEATNVVANYGNANLVYGTPDSTITIEVTEFGRIENVNNRPIVISSSNVLEGANLFFTNARVVANVSNLSINVFADVNTTGAGIGQALVWDGNLWVPQTTISGNITGTSNIANLVASLSNHTTSNLAEGANLYFTNERVQANIANLSVNVLIDVDTTGASIGQALVWNGTNWAPLTVDAGSANSATLANTALFANVANLANLVASLENHTTSNVAEGANLYFTNVRALAALGGQYVGTTNAVVFSNVTANVFSGNIGGGANNQLVIQLASNVTGFLQAPNVDYTFLRYDSANGIVWGPVPGANTITYLANSIALDPSYGTYNSGNVLSIQTVGDYNLDANNYYSINETATTPGYIAYIDFTTVQTFNRIVINLFYTQNSAHVIYVDLWNKDTLAWDSFGSYNGLGTYYQFALAVLTPEKYIEANGLVEMRLYHASGGNTGHNHRIDYVALEYSTQGPQGPKGTTGSTGATGAGVATGGDTGQILYKANSTNYATYWGNLITSNVEEGANLWFTNTRSRAAVSGGLGVLYNQSTGEFSLAQNVSTHSDVTFANLTVTGNLTVQGNALIFESNTLIINDPLIQIGKNPVSGDAVDLGFFGHYIQTGDVERHAGLFRDATDGNFKLFTNLDPEPVTIVDTANASFRYANLFVNQLYGNVNGFINTISNFSTTNLIEGTNQYFTQARARQSISVTGGGSYNSTTGVISIDTVAASDNVIHTEETFTGNGVATIFTLTSNATRTDSLVVIDGLVQFYTTDYTISGNTSLIFTSPPADGETIKVLRLQTASSGGASSSQVEDWGTIDDAVAFAEDYGSIE